MLKVFVKIPDSLKHAFAHLISCYDAICAGYKPSLKYLVFTHSYVFVSHAADEDSGLRTGVPGFRQLEEASKFAAVVWFESVGSQRLGFHR
jgi:hypothetical protein